MIAGLRELEEAGPPRPFVDRLVVLDDDPTGVQTLAGIRVLLAWDPATLIAALAGRPSVHLITNSRALAPAAAGALVADAARLVLDSVPDAHLVLRGDSTLRGHLREEYEAVRRATAPDSWPVLVLVPALPSAGRVTRGGVHMIERDGESTPLDQTEYARDGVFSYSTARLPSGSMSVVGSSISALRVGSLIRTSTTSSKFRSQNGS